MTPDTDTTLGQKNSAKDQMVLGCPDCKFALRETADGLECPGCGRSPRTEEA